MQTEIMLTVAQIVDGEATCAYCAELAVFTIATGADPDPEPMCLDHGLDFIQVTAAVSRKLFTSHPGSADGVALGA